MSKMDILIGKAKQCMLGLAASGKKNAPSLMTAGSVILGWTAVYIFWKQSKKAEECIRREEALLDERTDSDIPPSERPKYGFIDKASVYLQYCWMALVLGVTSSALAIGANSINLSRLAEMALLTQFMSGKEEKQKELIEKLKAEVGDKKYQEMCEELREERHDEKFPKEEVMESVTEEAANGKTLFIDQFTGKKFRKNILEVTDGIASFNERLRDKRKDAIRKRVGDAFFVSSDTPWTTDEDACGDIYSALDLEELLAEIGEIGPHESMRMGELLEFRYYGGGDLLKTNQILSYKNLVDPESGFPVVCYIDYEDLLAPSTELLERNM